MKGLVEGILWGGTLCGVLDAFAATISFAILQVAPIRVWQNVASGLLGSKAFQMGKRSAVLGLIIHFVIAFSAATVFCVAALKTSFVLAMPITSGAAHGVAVFILMNLIVLPLSAMPKRPLSRTRVITQIVIHIFCVGLPISLSASRFLQHP